MAALGTLVVLAGGPVAVGYLAAGLAVLIVADLVLAGSPARLAVQRSGAAQAHLAEPVPVRVQITNTGGRRVRGWLRPAWPPSAGAHPGQHRLDVPPAGTAAVTTTLRPTRRGERVSEFVAVRSIGPFGLAGRQRSLPARHAVRVLPAFPSRRLVPAKLARLRELDGRVRSVVRGQGSEFDALREYVPGDDVRSIDWRAAARTPVLVVRTWRPERDRRLLLLIDSGRTSAARLGEETRLEVALDAALLLAAVAEQAGDRIDVVVHDVTVRAAASAGRRAAGFGTLAATLAAVEPVLLESDPAGIVGEIRRRAGARALVVLFTALEPAAIRAGLGPLLPLLTRRHVVLLASAADPQVHQLAAGRSSGPAVYGAAAAAAALAERARLTDELRRAGIEVVDAPPEHFAGAVVDRYLQLKAAGRL